MTDHVQTEAAHPGLSQEGEEVQGGTEKAEVMGSRGQRAAVTRQEAGRGGHKAGKEEEPQARPRTPREPC